MHSKSHVFHRPVSSLVAHSLDSVEIYSENSRKEFGAPRNADSKKTSPQNLRLVLRTFAHDDVSVGSWFIGVDVKHVDEGKFCCSSWSSDCEKLIETTLQRLHSIRASPCKGKSLSEPGFDPGTCGLWAHHASAAPL
ncbi:probable beta-1 3-galactosyltransferase 11 [Phtheirospermum japonicum]|uniref:Probable beta-1 3-galactosyltransferase 11 n=1 Tax=Phtheirospermum japonicum TaxID=374723 RepID=A0A830BYR4_9LAMI|nr:probable beta-1 3-galactosyltransferase 11 [Phtheirospermum japonicum]